MHGDPACGQEVAGGGTYCVLAHAAVRLLTDRGRRAIRLDDGTPEWRLSELPGEAGDLG
ncbi:hypothetical protein [Streptomyces sp. NPDC001450]